MAITIPQERVWFTQGTDSFNGSGTRQQAKSALCDGFTLMHLQQMQTPAHRS